MPMQHESQQLFVKAIQHVKAAKAPLDENALEVSESLVFSYICTCNLLFQTLTVFLGAVLAKRYTNPSADIITVLAGLDEVDAVFFDFASAIENTLRTGRSCKFLWSCDPPIY